MKVELRSIIELFIEDLKKKGIIVPNWYRNEYLENFINRQLEN